MAATLNPHLFEPIVFFMILNEWFGQGEGLGHRTDGQFLWLEAVWAIVGGLGLWIKAFDKGLIFQDRDSCFPRQSILKETIP